MTYYVQTDRVNALCPSAEGLAWSTAISYIVIGILHRDAHMATQVL